MTRYISLLILCLFSSSWLWAQGSQISQSSGRISSGNAVTFDDRYQGVKGTPYIFSEWQKGLVFPSNMDAIHIEYLNFDRHSLELCQKENEDSKPSLLNKYLIDSFRVAGTSDTLEFRRVKLPEASEYLYMELVYHGGVTLFLDYAKTFNEADYEQSYSADRRYDEYVDTPGHYLQLEQGGELYFVKKNKKQFSSLFGAYSGQVLEYMKAEKTSLKSREDLISLMQYYDSIKK